VKLHDIFGLSYSNYKNFFPEIPENNLPSLLFLGCNNLKVILKRLNQKVSHNNRLIDFFDSILLYLQNHNHPDDIRCISEDYLNLSISRHHIDFEYLNKLREFPGTTSFNSCLVCKYAYGKNERRNCRLLDLSNFQPGLRYDSKCYLQTFNELGMIQLLIDISLGIQGLKALHDRILQVRAFIRSLIPFSKCKPYLPEFRPEKHFKPGDMVLFSYSPVLSPDKVVWAEGIIEKMQTIPYLGKRKFCEIRLKKNLNLISDAGKGRLFTLAANDPDIMHAWEYDFLINEIEFMRKCWYTNIEHLSTKGAELVRLAA
jgi:hypothetical protein